MNKKNTTITNNYIRNIKQTKNYKEHMIEVSKTIENCLRILSKHVQPILT